MVVLPRAVTVRPDPVCFSLGSFGSPCCARFFLLLFVVVVVVVISFIHAGGARNVSYTRGYNYA